MTELATRPNQLAVIVKESGLEETKSQFILAKFQNFFDLAADWERKAKLIVVTDESQEFEISTARAGRLMLRKKRLEIESARKELKEQSLREGKAIDGIANVLKALIVPIEEYLEKQENFAEIKRLEREEKERQEAEAKALEAERKRLAEEEAERVRIRQENERLQAEIKAAQAKAEAEQRRAKEAAEKARAEAEKAAAKAKAEIDRKNREIAEAKRIADEQARKAEEEKRRIEENARRAAQEAERKRIEEARKIEADRAKAEEIARRAELQRQADDAKAQAVIKELEERNRLLNSLRNSVKCPNCGHSFQIEKE